MIYSIYTWVFTLIILTIIREITAEYPEECIFKLSELPIPEEGLVLGDPRFDPLFLLISMSYDIYALVTMLYDAIERRKSV